MIEAEIAKMATMQREVEEAEAALRRAERKRKEEEKEEEEEWVMVEEIIEEVVEETVEELEDFKGVANWKSEEATVDTPREMSSTEDTEVATHPEEEKRKKKKEKKAKKEKKEKKSKKKTMEDAVPWPKDATLEDAMKAAA